MDLADGEMHNNNLFPNSLTELEVNQVGYEIAITCRIPERSHHQLKSDRVLVRFCTGCQIKNTSLSNFSTVKVEVLNLFT